MRAGKIVRVVVRAAIVGLLTAGAWLAASAAAHADNEWLIGPTGGDPSGPRPAVVDTAESGSR